MKLAEQAQTARPDAVTPEAGAEHIVRHQRISRGTWSGVMRKRLDRYQKLLRLETDERLLQVVDALITQLLLKHEGRSQAEGREAQPAAKRRHPPASR